MSLKLKIAAVALNIAWADPEENLKNVRQELIRLEDGIDLVVLPELFNSGYVDDNDLIKTLSETPSGETMTRINEWAKEFNIAISGSFLCRIGNNIYNRAFFIEPSGDEYFYDKFHLFSLSSENKVYTKGTQEPPIIRFRGWNISMIVCYDLRFPVWCRNRNLSYDMMLVPANWPASRQYAWEHLLIGRSIENQAIYIGANRSGTDDYGEYDNLTYILDATGHHIGVKSPSGTIYAIVDKDELAHVRKRLPFAPDADDFIIHGK